MLKSIGIAAASLALGACAAEPPAMVDYAANASAPTPRVRYQAVTAGSRTFQPTAPKGWEQQNQSVTPRRGGS